MKQIHIIGGGTFSYVRTHLALATPAFGTTAKRLKDLCELRFTKMDVNLHLTKMADPSSTLITNDDVNHLVLELKEDFDTKVIFFNPAMCDYNANVEDLSLALIGSGASPSGKYESRLKTSEGTKYLKLTPAEKVLKTIRNGRKDIFLVAFKTTCGATEREQYMAALDLMKKNSCNLVLANDVKTRLNMIITPEEAIYHKTTNRDEALEQLVDMAYYRSHLSFTHSTVVNGVPVSWDSPEVYPTLRTVVDYCIQQNAYKPFNGATVGHFAVKISDTEFLTSIRKSNFNDLKTNGLVRVKTDGPDSVIAYGAKPSVGGQSQRIIFQDNEEYNYDCIVHFHCPIKSDSLVPVVSQREYECGSHNCGRHTSENLKRFDEGFSCVMLDNHGPNIVFNHHIDPNIIIKFIDNNFDLSDKTGGVFENENLKKISSL